MTILWQGEHYRLVRNENGYELQAIIYASEFRFFHLATPTKWITVPIAPIIIGELGQWFEQQGATK